MLDVLNNITYIYESTFQKKYGIGMLKEDCQIYLTFGREKLY